MLGPHDISPPSVTGPLNSYNAGSRVTAANDPLSVTIRERVRDHEQGIRTLEGHRGDGTVEVLGLAHAEPLPGGPILS